MFQGLRYSKQAPPAKRLALPPATRMCLAVLGLSVIPAGCVAARRSWTPPCDPNTLNSATFLHYLAATPLVTVDEGMRAVLLLTDDGARFPTFERRKNELVRRGAVKTAWALDADNILDKGTLAYMLGTVCDLPRGLNETVFAAAGWGDRRNSLRACVHEGLLRHGVPSEPVKGGELLSAMTQAERFLAEP
jgi:hypothetical protein